MPHFSYILISYSNYGEEEYHTYVHDIALLSCSPQHTCYWLWKHECWEFKLFFSSQCLSPLPRLRTELFCFISMVLMNVLIRLIHTNSSTNNVSNLIWIAPAWVNLLCLITVFYVSLSIQRAFVYSFSMVLHYLCIKKITTYYSILYGMNFKLLPLSVIVDIDTMDILFIRNLWLYT